MMVMKALFKQLFGEKYQRASRSLSACLILFFAVNIAEIRMAIAPEILFLAAAAVSAGMMWQALGSSQNTQEWAGLFMLPFPCGKISLLIALAFAGYVLVSKTFFLLALFFALQKWSGLQIAAALLCACNGCLMSAAWYTMAGRKSLFPVILLWCGGMVYSVFFVREIMAFAAVILASLFVSLWRLRAADAYVFCRQAAKRPVRSGKRKGSMFCYLPRYLLMNKSYLLNTVGLCGVAVVLPFILGDFEGLYILPLGFAILCMNTPVCTLLSCDKDLERAVRMLPGQAVYFCIRYGLFLFFVHMAVNGVYLVSWQAGRGGVGIADIFTALFIALQGAVLSVWLEWRHPVRNWRTLTDLWHHPRKYIVPLIMMLAAGGIGLLKSLD